MHPSHEAGMNIAGRVGHDEIAEFAIDIGELGSLPRKGLAEPGANRVRDRLPDRALADRGDIVDHVIEHAMTLRANLVPVLRIERLARLRPQRRLSQDLGHAARSRPNATWRSSIAAKASNILRICGGL